MFDAAKSDVVHDVTLLVINFGRRRRFFPLAFFYHVGAGFLAEAAFVDR